MIALQSLREFGLLIVLILCGNAFAFCGEGEPTLAATAQYRDPLVPIPDPGTTGLAGPGGSVDCQCRRCSPESHRSGGFFSWFKRGSERGPERDCVAESNAACSGCNVNPEPPFGASYFATTQAQIAKGEAALMVLHHFDFVPCQGELNDRGRLQLQKIARRALQNPFPIIIQASPRDPELDAARLAAVISELAFSPVPAERVVIGPSVARALDGLDAQLIHQNLLRLMSDGSAQRLAPTGAAGPALR